MALCNLITGNYIFAQGERQAAGTSSNAATQLPTTEYHNSEDHTMNHSDTQNLKSHYLRYVYKVVLILFYHKMKTKLDMECVI
jgi:hypothetical protein